MNPVEVLNTPTQIKEEKSPKESPRAGLSPKWLTQISPVYTNQLPNRVKFKTQKLYLQACIEKYRLMTTMKQTVMIYSELTYCYEIHEMIYVKS